MSFPRYPEYKDSGVEWLGEVPAHWSVKRLRYVAELNPSKSEVRSLPGDTEVSFIPMESVGEDGSLDLKQVRPLEEVIGGYTYVRDGDVTFAKITPCFENGKAALMNGLESGVGFGTTELTVLRPDPEQTRGDYLFRVIHSEPFRVIGESHMYGAGGQKRVPDDFARDFQIAWPPKEEQQVIAAFLDFETARIDALIEEQQRLIELLKEKRQAVISHAVTKGLDPDVPMKDSGVEWLGEVPAHWEVKRIKWSTKSCKNGIWGSDPKGDENDIVCIRVADFDRQRMRVELNEPTYRNVTPKELEGRLVTKGDLLLEKSGGGEKQPVGFVVLYEDPAPAVCANFVAKMELASGMSSSFWRYMHAAGYSIGLNVPSIKQTSGIQNLDQQSYLDERAAFPPEEEQVRIASFLDRETARIDALVEEAKQGISLLQERRSALISAAVTGKIDVRGWRAESKDGEAELPKVAEPGTDYSAREART